MMMYNQSSMEFFEINFALIKAEYYSEKLYLKSLSQFFVS